MSEQSPNGVNGFSTLLVESEQFAPAFYERVGVRHSAYHGVVLMAAGDEEIRRRQDRHRDPGRRQPIPQGFQAIGRQQRVLGAVSDRNASPVSVLFGEVADEADVHLVGGGADVEVDVDVAVVLERKLEDAPDLAGVVGVVSRCTADHVGASLQRRLHVAVGLRRIGPALLGEDAQLQIDAPGVVGRELLQGLEAAQADVGIDLHVGAHVGDAVQDALLQGLGGPRVDVLHRESGLDRGHPLHVIPGAARGRCAPVDDARLVKVDMGLDETGRHEAAVEVESTGLGPDLRLDGRDPALGKRRCPSAARLNLRRRSELREVRD